MIQLNLVSLGKQIIESLPSSEKNIPLALALITGCGIAASYYCFFSGSEKDASNSNYWTSRSWIPKGVQQEIGDALLPFDHPAREILDQIYLRDITPQHGFTKLGSGRDIQALAHPQLAAKGLMVKEPSSDKKVNSLVKRVRGHTIANELIKERNFAQIKVTQNWIYPRPDNESIAKWGAYHLSRLAGLSLKTLNLQCPSWIECDRIFLNRLIVVEEFIEVNRPKLEQIKGCDFSLIDEYIEVALEVGFQDAHPKNFCFDQTGRLVLFDIEYSNNKEKRLRRGMGGVNILFGHIFRDYINEKLSQWEPVAATTAANR